jgi:hypothetical protein
MGKQEELDLFVSRVPKENEALKTSSNVPQTAFEETDTLDAFFCLRHLRKIYRLRNLYVSFSFCLAGKNVFEKIY